MSNVHPLHVARRASRVFRLPPREIATTAHVVAVILVVELLIRRMPLPRLSRLLGVRLNLQPVDPDVERFPLTELTDQARRQLRCTWNVADAWPFSDGPCLRRALVGAHLMRDLNPSVRLGVAEFDDTVHAHAWVEIDDRPLEDVETFQRFALRQHEATP